jgi:hypothetical protein
MAIVNENEIADEVGREVRRIKEALAEKMDFDIDRILEVARRRQKESGREILSAPVRSGGRSETRGGLTLPP